MLLQGKELLGRLGKVVTRHLCRGARNRRITLRQSARIVILRPRNLETIGKPEYRFRVDTDPSRTHGRFAMAAKVKPIPDGFHAITPYLIVDDAEKSIAFMQKAFGAQYEHEPTRRPDG